MSRVGKQVIEIPEGVSVSVEGSIISVKGPKGTLSRTLHETVSVEQADGESGAKKSLRVVSVSERAEHSRFHGLSRALVNNMVVGVSSGFEKKLLLNGVGYRAALSGKQLNLTLGYSHPVVFNIPEGVEIRVGKPTEISVAGIDKEKVGQVAAVIRAFRKPEPYHGKGVRYADEVIVTKVGKSGAKK